VWTTLTVLFKGGQIYLFETKKIKSNIVNTYLFETKKIKSNIVNTYLDYINSFISYSKSEADFQFKTYSASTCYTHLDYIETYTQFQTYSNKIEERDIDDLAAFGGRGGVGGV
jgi:hypothetical protein